jgi:hypothetical protein
MEEADHRHGLRSNRRCRCGRDQTEKLTSPHSGRGRRGTVGMCRLTDHQHHGGIDDVEDDGGPEDRRGRPCVISSRRSAARERADVEAGIDEAKHLAGGAGRRGVAHDHVVARGLVMPPAKPEVPSSGSSRPIDTLCSAIGT